MCVCVCMCIYSDMYRYIDICMYKLCVYIYIQAKTARERKDKQTAAWNDDPFVYVCTVET